MTARLHFDSCVSVVENEEVFSLLHLCDLLVSDRSLVAMAGLVAALRSTQLQTIPY